MTRARRAAVNKILFIRNLTVHPSQVTSMDTVEHLHLSAHVFELIEALLTMAIINETFDGITALFFMPPSNDGIKAVIQVIAVKDVLQLWFEAEHRGHVKKHRMDQPVLVAIQVLPNRFPA